MDLTEDVPENFADFISPIGPNGALSPSSDTLGDVAF